jgi:branched-chain amino acid transport system ATP-binding protein
MAGNDRSEGSHPLGGVEHRPGVAKPDPILVVEKMRRAFGGLVAVDVDHLEIQRGIITALIGPNGAGKTTFFNLMTGFDKPDTGTVALNGKNVDRLKSHGRAREGMVRTFQLTKALTKLSVMENMKLGAREQTGERFLQSLFPFLWRSQEDAIQQRARQLLKRFRLDHMDEEYSGTLSGGQRKLLEMARALMSSPAVVMLDEPVAGVNPALTQSLLDHVKQLPKEGVTVVFVEHDMDVVWDISDWVVVMAEGTVIAEGYPESIGKNQAVIDAYLGSGNDGTPDGRGTGL